MSKMYIHLYLGGTAMKTIGERSDIDMSVQDTPPQKKKINWKCLIKSGLHLGIEVTYLLLHVTVLTPLNYHHLH